MLYILYKHLGKICRVQNWLKCPYCCTPILTPTKKIKKIAKYANCMQIIKKGPSIRNAETLCCIMWAHQGMILGPPDYESGALTN